MNLGNKLAIGEVVDHGADHDPADHHSADHDPAEHDSADRVAEVAAVTEVLTPTVRAEAPPEPVPAHAD